MTCMLRNLVDDASSALKMSSKKEEVYVDLKQELGHSSRVTN